MPWVLKMESKESWFKMWTGIGPAFTDKVKEAAKFGTKRAAMKSPAWSFALTSVEAVKLPKTQRERGLK